MSVPNAPECLGLVPGMVGDRPVTLACGGDVRGLVYALLELADAVIHADEPQSVFDLRSPVVEQPTNPIRSVARLFTSEVEEARAVIGWYGMSLKCGKSTVGFRDCTRSNWMKQELASVMLEGKERMCCLTHYV